MLHNFVALLKQNEKLHIANFCIKMKNLIFFWVPPLKFGSTFPPKKNLNFFYFVSGRDAFRSFWCKNYVSTPYRGFKIVFMFFIKLIKLVYFCKKCSGVFDTSRF